MGVFRDRPLAFACAAAAFLALGAALIPWRIRLPLCVICFLAAVGFLIPALVRRRCGPRQTVALLSFLLCAVLLFGSWRFFDLRSGVFTEKAGTETVAEGVVTGRSDSSYQTDLSLSLTELDGNRTDLRVRLSCAYLSALRVGDRIRFTGTLAPARTDGIPDGFAGTIVCAGPEDCRLLSEGHFSLRTRLSILNETVSQTLAERIGGKEGGLAAALLLGNRSGLDGRDTLAFRRAGVSHLLALSGLHVGILIAALDRFLRLCRVPRTVRSVPILLLAFFYLALTGASPSTARAVLTASLLYLSLTLRRPYDPFTALSAALALILAVQPYAVLDIGLWFSFAAAGGIVVFLPAVIRLSERHGRAPRGMRRHLGRAGKWLLLAAAVGLFAFCATLPLTAFTFGEVSVLSVPVTILLTPVLSAALVLLALAAFLPLPPLIFAAGKTLALMRAIVGYAASRRGVTLLLNDPRPLVFVLLTALALFVCACVTLRRRWRLLLSLPVLFAVCALLAANAVVPSAKSGVGLTYRVSGNREYLLFTRGSRAVAVDLSGGSYATALKTDLNACGCTELDELILTHYHSSATHLLDRVSAGMRLGGVCLPIPQNADEEALAARVREEAERLGIPTRTADESEPLRDLSLRVGHDPGTTEAAVTVFASVGDRAVTWYDLRPRGDGQTVFLAEALARSQTVFIGRHGTKQGAAADLSGKRATAVYCAGEDLSGIVLPPGAVLTRVEEGTVGFLLR